MARKRTQDLHPRAQVQRLVKSAKIALGKADRLRRYGRDNESIRAAHDYDDKAAAAIRKAVLLNEEHDLGYPIPPDAVRWAKR